MKLFRCAVLVAFATLAGCHSFATSAICCFARALCCLVFEMFFRLAHSACGLTCFFCGCQLNSIRIARKFAIGSVIFFTFGRWVHSLTKTFVREKQKTEDEEYDNLFHVRVLILQIDGFRANKKWVILVSFNPDYQASVTFPSIEIGVKTSNC